MALGLEALRQARRPEDVFGALGSNAAHQEASAKKLYHRLSHAFHPDTNGNDARAEEAFKLLGQWWQAAQDAIHDGTYGQTPATPLATIKTGRHEYAVTSVLTATPLAARYRADGPDGGVVIKVASDHRDNDLLHAEAETLRHLREDGAKAAGFLPFLPELERSFSYHDGGPARQANVFKDIPGLVALTGVNEAYPGGIDPRDMAWMWRRLLWVLGYAHARGVVHGAVLPPHVCIHPEGHGLVLGEWAYAAHDGVTIQAMHPDYQDWYPPEVAKKQPPTPATDIAMGARCMVQLLGGDPVTGQLPSTIPTKLQAHLRGCLLDSQRQRPQDAWALYDEFLELVVALWGPRRFRPFTLPNT